MTKSEGVVLNFIGTPTASGGETGTNVSITVTLKKEDYTGSDITENFYVKVTGETVQN